MGIFSFVHITVHVFFKYCKDVYLFAWLSPWLGDPKLDKNGILDLADIMVGAKPEIRSRIVGLSLSSKVCGLYFYRGSSFLCDNQQNMTKFDPNLWNLDPERVQISENQGELSRRPQEFWQL